MEAGFLRGRPVFLICPASDDLEGVVGQQPLSTPQRSDIELLASQIYCPFATRAAK